MVDDLTADSSCNEGFLRLRRLLVRHQYDDGSCSPEYSCDVVSRRGTDAVGVVLWYRTAEGEIMVVLKEGVRPPIWLRRQQNLIQPDPSAPLMLTELVAGVLEPGDEGNDGLRRRAAAETMEEAGVKLPASSFQLLGAPMFPSPGVSDEKVFLLCAELNQPPPISGTDTGGDGSPMEHGTRVLVMPLMEAIGACERGEIPAMLAELGLRRLHAHLVKCDD